MRWLSIFAAVLVLSVTPVHAQLPAQLRSAGISEAEWQLARDTIQREARQRGQREAVIQTLAIEIFSAQPGQSFETYVALIEAGAARLPQALAAAQALDPGRDPRLRRLRERAVQAARQGRLQEALQAQDEYTATLQAALTQLVEGPQLELAAANAAGAETAFALGDYHSAAARYEQAVASAPESRPLVRWRYRMDQAQVLADRGVLYADVADLSQALYVLRTEAQPLAPEETHFAEYAQTMIARAAAAVEVARLEAFRGYYEMGQVFGELQDIAEALTPGDIFDGPVEHREIWADAYIQMARVATALTEMGSAELLGNEARYLGAAEIVYTREAEPRRWADIQTYAGDEQLVRVLRVGPGGESALPYYRGAMAVHTQDAAPRQWAALQERIAVAAWALESDLAASMTAFDAALTVRTRDAAPGAWAQTQARRGDVLLLATQRGEGGAAAQAVDAYRGALAAIIPARAENLWMEASIGLGRALVARRGEGDFAEAETILGNIIDRAGGRDISALAQARATYALAALRAAQGRASEAQALADAARPEFRFHEAARREAEDFFRYVASD